MAVATIRVDGSEEECPICLEVHGDVEQLVHHNADETGHTSDGRDVRSHRACGACRMGLRQRNQTCPWCRDTMVWLDVCEFLKVLKNNIKIANEPQGLAALMATWQEYEMTRSKSDIRLFAKDLCEDVGLAAHLDHALANDKLDFMRDSAGLWIRFFAMLQDGEIQLASEADSTRLHVIIDCTLDKFDADGGGNAAHTGAMYAQAACALLCANMSGSSTQTLVKLTKRIGEAAVRAHGRFRDAKRVRDHCLQEYVTSVSVQVWGSVENDIVLRTFWS